MVRQCWIFTLQKADDLINGKNIFILQQQYPFCIGRMLFCTINCSKQFLQTLFGKQLQGYINPKIGLKRGNTFSI